MAVLTPTSAKGRTKFAAGGPARTHDDRSDSWLSGAYSHNPLEWAATEADEWNSTLLFLIELCRGGMGSLPVYNNTGGALAAGTLVYITGTNQSQWYIAKADGADPVKPAQFVLHEQIANGAAGEAYAYDTVSGVNTSGGSDGDPVYLSAVTPGAWILTPPTNPQVVGRVLVAAASGSIAFWPGGVNARTLPRTHASTHLPGAADALTVATPGSSAVGDSAAEGTAASFSRSDHKHGREAFGSPGASAPGDSGSDGVATTLARADHKHGREAFGSPGASAPGDSGSDGVATTLARADHKHGREAFGTTVGTVCQGNDSRLSDARTPTAHKTSHEPGGSDAMTVDAAAGTGSLRTLGTGATAACAGNDSRLSDARTPTAHMSTHQTGADRLLPKAVTVADATSITPNSDNGAIVSQQNTQAAGTLTINADAGTPAEGQTLQIRVKCTNAQTLSWNAAWYEGLSAPKPVTTSGGGLWDFFNFHYLSGKGWIYTGCLLGI